MKKKLLLWKHYIGLLLFSLLLTLQLPLSAQISHAVTVSNGTFTSDILTITVGDTVVWTNTEGNHNVNGTTATFPSNPESFGNEVGPPGWVFTHVFTKAGVYDYHCDPHAQFGMVGKVIVLEQTSHAVTVSNGKFTPDSLTIYVGDTVVWTNTQGNHNVNGTTATFPSNPESFGNEVGPPGWVFTHVFTKAGVYDYHCDPHAQFGMVGKVIVLERTSHAVTVSNGTFTPDILTITVGDTVVWTNTQGNHNVNGTTGTFPSNPESFGNEVGPPGWVFTHVFTKAGVYDYHCDPHAQFGMVGKVIVLERTSHAVTVSNGTFTPDSLTIYVGDTVVWTNTQGNHNVNGTTGTFPSNPESFGNEVGPPGWIFTHVFTKAGVYDYHCDPHAQFGMVGKVIVLERTSHAVTVSNGKFTPDSLTIYVGDTVVWTNTQGNHNVNGTTGTFPSNPESFGNEVGPPGWVFTHVFTKAGVYDYHCDPHAQFGMVGKVIVLERTSHAVTVSNGTFTPDILTITVGDTVVWTNTQGNHNVNGTTGTFPSNPESFGNEVGPPGWVFTHVFTKAGVYDYHCDPHAQFGMVGKVIVLERTSHAVTVSNGTFTPDSLTIYVGDTVVWTNTQGNHNVNGTTATFPSNPESFGNEVGPPGWVFTHVFTKAGVYDYHCDPHAQFGMVGKVIVLERTSHAVTVSNGKFTPDSLTIYVGDTVVWTNTQGNHNVNGTTGTFPSNPESFGNEVGPPGWVFSHVFTKAGVYDYHCDPHAQFGMVGKVIVLERTSHAVTVSNGTFTPDSLTINVGDTVVWTNTQGNHNVNGTTGTFPSNPESFGNEVGPPGWVFTHVFTKAGVYDYHCDPHAQFGMVGKVVVIDNTTTGLEPTNEISEVLIYPNPVIDQLFISSKKIIKSISIFNITGAKILDYRKIDKTELELSLAGIRTGVYLVDVQFDDNTSQVSRLVKR